jgi:iron(III) transport system ATP-binding protein
VGRIRIANVEKRYGSAVVIPGLTLDIDEGEFFTLLGPSGCGKTTLLRMIAGFNSIEAGEIYFNDLKINDVAPSRRNIGMVFQNYAVFPHLSVRQNVAYGLKNRKLDRAIVEKETDLILKKMQIDHLADRMPDKLSGGQQQRVALARALVIKPDVLLMDEPLSNLDAKLRMEMRSVIREIQREIGITTVYVTHDQEEAMSISDTIAVMHNGQIQHIGSPKNIYQRPSNQFVATFIGRTNILDAEIKGGSLILQESAFSHESWRSIPDGPVKISVRPEEFVVNGFKDGLSGLLLDSVYLGLNTHYTIKLNDEKVVEMVRESELSDVLEPGLSVSLLLKNDKINIFTNDGSTNLLQVK